MSAAAPSAASGGSRRVANQGTQYLPWVDVAGGCLAWRLSCCADILLEGPGSGVRERGGGTVSPGHLYFL
jgi:hypothetical protein